MQKILLIYILLNNIFAQENSERIKKYLYKELAAAERLASKIDGVDPKISYKILESRYELFKLEFKQENVEFLKIPPDKKIGRNKDEFFPKSAALYKRIIVDAKKNIKIFKNTRFEYIFYYMMGAIANDFSKFDKAIFYLSRVIRLAKKKDNEFYNAMDILAELYFNKKQFRQATPLYRQLLKLKSRPSYHRHLYNYSWILLNGNNKKKALSTLLEVISYNGKNADRTIRLQSIEQSPIFFVEANQVVAGTKFLLENNKEKVINLLRLAISKGMLKSGYEAYLVSAKKLPKNVKFDLEVLDLYESNNQIFYAVNILKIIANKFSSFDSEGKNNIVNKLRSYLENNRKFFVKTKYSENNLINLKIKFTFELVKVLSRIDRNNLFEYLGFRSETLKYTGLIEKSYLSFLYTAKLAIKNKKVKWYQLTLDIALGILNENEFLKEKYIRKFANVYIKFGKDEKVKAAILNDQFIDYFQSAQYVNASKLYAKMKQMNMSTVKYEQSFYQYAFAVKSVAAIDSRIRLLQKLKIHLTKDFLNEANSLKKNIKLGIFNKISQKGNFKQSYVLYKNLKKDKIDKKTETQLLANLFSKIKSEGIDKYFSIFKQLSDRWVEITPVSSSTIDSFVILSKDLFYRNDLQRFNLIASIILDKCQSLEVSSFLSEFAPYFYDSNFMTFNSRFEKCGISTQKLKKFTLSFFWSEFINDFSEKKLALFLSLYPDLKKEISQRIWFYYLTHDPRLNIEFNRKIVNIFSSNLIDDSFQSRFKSHQILLSNLKKIDNYKNIIFSQNPRDVQGLISQKINEVNDFNLKLTSILNNQEAGVQSLYLQKIKNYNSSFLKDIAGLTPPGLSSTEVNSLVSALQPVIVEFKQKNNIIQQKIKDLSTLNNFNWSFYNEPLSFEKAFLEAI